MCTVTFIGTNKDQIILTSNRDEKVRRETEHPILHDVDKQKVAYPRDKLGGGSWISLGNNGVACCLLNGAFKLHERKQTYRKSRGQIVLDVFRFPTIESFIENCNLSGIEPFTLILFDSKVNQLYQLIWDEEQKHVELLKTDGNYFWSSATLYSPLIAVERKEHFFDVIKHNDKLDMDLLFNLHERSKENGGFLLKRDDGIETVSITQLLMNKHGGTMVYHDLLESDVKIIRQSWHKVLL